MLNAFLIAGILFCTVAPFAQTGKKISLAVHDLQAEGVEQSEAKLISERLRAGLLNTGLYRVMERGQMDAVLKEQMFQQSGACSDQACLVEMGQLLGVEQVLSGTVGKIGQTYTLAVRLIDVATGEILTALNSDCKCAIDEVMQTSTKDIVNQLVRKSGAPAGNITVPPVPPKPQFGFLSVESKPAGANVIINGAPQGITPFHSDKLEPGKLTLKIELPGYKSLEERIKVLAGDTAFQSYTLKALPVEPPVTAESPANKKTKSRWGIRAGIGGGTLIVLGAGIFFNSQAQTKINAAAQIESEYDAGHSNSDFNTYSASYGNEIKWAKTNMLYRNTGYVLGLLGAAGFALTWRF
jgi:TolB-like protein